MAESKPVKDERGTNQTVDVNYVKTQLEAFEDLLMYLKELNTSGLSDVLFQVSYLVEKYNHFLLLCISGKNSYGIKKEIDPALWKNHFQLKFLFGNQIQYGNVSGVRSIQQLHCNICNTDFDQKSDDLISHVVSLRHVDNFRKIHTKAYIDDDAFWGKNIFLKLLFQQYVVFKRTTNTYYCKICWIEFRNKSCMIEHLTMLDHLTIFKSIVEFKIFDARLKSSSEFDSSILDTESITVAANGNLETQIASYFPSLDKTVSKYHDLFMLKLYEKHPGSGDIPIFCQVCCYNKTSEFVWEDGSPDRFTHESGKEHITNAMNIDSKVLVSFEWKYCHFCKAYFYSDDTFNKFHSNNIFHKSIVSAFYLENTGIEARMLDVASSQNDSMDMVTNENISIDNEIECRADKKSVGIIGTRKTPIATSTAVENVTVATCDTTSDAIVVCDDNITLESLNVLKVNLQSVMKKLLTDVKSASKTDTVYGFFCHLCVFWCNDITEWNHHINNYELHKYFSRIRKDNQTKQCNCNITILCDDLFLKKHQLTTEHMNLVRFIQKKSSSSTSLHDVNRNDEAVKFDLLESLINSKESKMDKCEIELQNDNNNNNMDDDRFEIMSFDDNFDNCSEVSSVVSTMSRRSGPYGSARGARNSRGYDKKTKTWVFGVRNLPTATPRKEIGNAFTRFGMVRNVYFVNSVSANVVVTLSNSSKSIVGTSIVINGRTVNIERKITKEADSSAFITENFTSITAFFSLIQKLDENARTALSGGDGSDRNRLPSLISDSTLLRHEIKRSCQQITDTIMIGSRATGLICGDPMYDIFVVIDNNYFNSKVKEEAVSSHAILIEQSLRSYDKFSNIKIRFNDSQRTITATHKQLKINFKLYFTNGIVVENTNLISTYLRCDERVRMLILLVKKWSKHIKLADILSQYAITWMVLFYLMSMKDKMIVPVADLRLPNQPGRKNIAGWDCWFCKDVSKLPKGRCDQSIYQLFCGFLLFYSDHNVSQFVLCPLTGDMYKKSKFDNFLLPYQFNWYKRVYRQSQNYENRFTITHGICLEDPFELNINLTKELCGRNLENFKWMCKELLNQLRGLTFKTT